MTTSGAFFTDLQADLVARVLDRIIPPSDRMPGAGEVAVAYLDGVVSASASLRRSFSHGLAQIQVRAHQAHAADFAALSGAQQDTVLRQVEAAEPAFFEALVRRTYDGYYTNPRVVELLGLEFQAPQPKGHQVEPGDFSPIELVKQRGAVYRDA